MRGDMWETSGIRQHRRHEIWERFHESQGGARQVRRMEERGLDVARHINKTLNGDS
jgi:hypothetical protein